MREYAIIIIVAFISLNSNAAIIGQGDIELGISRDNEKNNAGLGLRYNVSRLSHENSIKAVTNMQLGSEEGRSLVATNAHEYQYENSYIDTDLNSNFNFFSPRLTWNNSAFYRIDFDNEINEKTDKVTTNYSKNEKIWNIVMGPSFTYSKSRWIDFQTDASISRQYLDPYHTNETQINANLSKSISKISRASISSSYTCTKNDNPLNRELCRSEVGLEMSTQGQNYSLTAKYGTSKNEQNKVNTYAVSSSVEINSTSTLDLTAYKVVDSISREKEDFELNRGATLAIKEGRNIQYLYEWSRNRLEINARRLLTKSIGATIISEDASLFYDFQLASILCRACSLSLNYEHSRFNDNSNQNITSLALNKNNNKRIASSISFRKTEKNEFDRQETYWSINFLIMYTSISNKISNR